MEKEPPRGKLVEAGAYHNPLTMTLGLGVVGALKTQILENTTGERQKVNSRLSPASVQLLEPHLKQDEGLADFILRMRLRPAALGRYLGLDRNQRIRVYHWFHRLGVDYHNWPIVIHKRPPLSQEKRKSIALENLKKDLRIEDPEEEIGRLIVWDRAGFVSAATKRLLRGDALNRRLKILGLDKKRLAYEYLLREEVFKFLSEREIIIFESYYRDGLPIKDIPARLGENKKTKKPLTRQSVNMMMDKAMEKVKVFVLFQASGKDSSDRPLIISGLEAQTGRRAFKALIRAGITTIRELSMRTEYELTNIKQINQNALTAIGVFLKTNGLTLNKGIREKVRASGVIQPDRDDFGLLKERIIGRRKLATSIINLLYRNNIKTRDDLIAAALNHKLRTIKRMGFDSWQALKSYLIEVEELDPDDIE